MPHGALVRYECQRQWQWRRLLWGLGLQVLLFAAILVVMNAARLGKTLDVLLFTQMWTVVLTSPAFAAIIREPLHERVPLPARYVILAKSVGASLLPLLFQAVIGGVLLIAYGWRGWGYVVVLTKAYLLLFSLIYLGISFGMLFSFVCRQINHAVQLGYLAFGILITDVFWFPPLVSQDLSAWTSLIMHLNPFVALSAVLRLDLFRTYYLYESSAIAGHAYPLWYRSTLLYLISAVGISLIASSVLRYRSSKPEGIESVS